MKNENFCFLLSLTYDTITQMLKDAGFDYFLNIQGVDVWTKNRIGIHVGYYGDEFNFYNQSLHLHAIAQLGNDSPCWVDTDKLIITNATEDVENALRDAVAFTQDVIDGNKRA